MRDLLTQPLCNPEDLGLPIPPDRDAASVCLPTWQDVVDYEEQHPRMAEVQKIGYPRFVYQQDILKLNEKLHAEHGQDKEDVVVLVTPQSAERLNIWLEAQTGRPGRIINLIPDGPTLVAYRRRCSAAVKSFWQHTGEGVSHRQARALIDDQYHHGPVSAHNILKDRLATHAALDADDVYLYGNGMQGIFTTYRCVEHLHPGKKNIQFGFPYVDTLKILEQFGSGCHFHASVSDHSYDELKSQLAKGDIAAIYTEIPSNPLLNCVDLIRLRALCDEFGTILIVDDSVTSTLNVDLRDVADVLTTSLTKYFSGSGNVVAGATFLMKSSRHYEALKQAMTQEYQPTLYSTDAETLEFNSRQYKARLDKVNDNAAQLLDALRHHPAIDQLYYPQRSAQQAFYDAVKRTDGGYGGVFSFTVHAPEQNAPRVYDALQICKGPSFGANFTMACPFTLLAHYHELDRVEALGLSRWLIRISIGMEEAEDLIQRFTHALDQAVIPT